jgi:hypothetical protein
MIAPPEPRQVLLQEGAEILPELNSVGGATLSPFLTDISISKTLPVIVNFLPRE